MYNDLLFDLRYAELKKKHPQIPMYALCGRAADAIEELDREAQQQHEFIKMLHGALEKVLEANKWISVDEALPEKGGTYLTVYKDGSVFPNEWLFYCRSWSNDEEAVDYWRPLPPPPIDGD